MPQVKRTTPIVDDEPTVRMTREELDAFLQIDAAMDERGRQHERPTVTDLATVGGDEALSVEEL